MKKLMLTTTALLSSFALLAETAVWVKTDSAEDWWGTAWSQDANWQSGSQPQTGDDVSLAASPNEGIESIATILQSYTSYDINALSGLACYDIIFALGTHLTVSDPSQFFGTFRVGANSWHSQGYNGCQPATLTLNAAEGTTLVANSLDNRYDLRVEVPTAETEAEIKHVVKTAAGAVRKTGSGMLTAKFDDGSANAFFVDCGVLCVRENDSDISLGHGIFAKNTSISVKSGEAASVGSLVVYGDSLVKTGDGDLLVGGFKSRDDNGNYDQARDINVTISAGGIGALSSQSADLTKIVTTPFIDLDASAANAFTTDSEDETLVTVWNDSISSRSANGVAADGGRLPKIVENGLNGKRTIDLGAFVGDDVEGDGTAGYVSFDSCAMKAFFVVMKRKTANARIPMIGAQWSWNDYYRPGDADSLIYANYWGGAAARAGFGDWRVNGVAVDHQTYRAPADEFILVSYETSESVGEQNYLGANPNSGLYGGSEIAEAIIYNVNLADGERDAIEAYLMNKWLGSNVPSATTSLAISNLTFQTTGDMKIIADKDMSVANLTGDGKLVKTGSGSLNVASASGVSGVEVREGSLSFAISGGYLNMLHDAWIHFDPSDSTTLTIDGDGRVTKMMDVDGDGAYASLSDRCVEYAQVSGPSVVTAPTTGLNLLDFGSASLIFPGSDNCGFKFSKSTSSAHTVITVVEKTCANAPGIAGDASGFAFSTWGTTGGELLSTTAQDTDLKNGKSTWMIDGVKCDPTTTVWPEGLHVIACSIPDQDANGNAQGGVQVSLLAQDRDAHMTIYMGGMRYGEVLVFEHGISDADLRSISTYLMTKWLGSEQDTSSGLAELSVAANANCEISGDIVVADNASIDLGYAKDASGTIVIDGDVTFGTNVNVTVEGGKGAIALMSADSFSGSLSTWTLNGDKPRFNISNGVLYAECGGTGIIITIR